MTATTRQAVYTPTTESIRRTWSAAPIVTEENRLPDEDVARNLAAFDRMLAEHDARVKAERDDMTLLADVLRKAVEIRDEKNAELAAERDELRTRLDTLIESLCVLIPEGDEAEHSNPEGDVDSIIVDCFAAYRGQLDAVRSLAEDLYVEGDKDRAAELDKLLGGDREDGGA